MTASHWRISIEWWPEDRENDEPLGYTHVVHPLEADTKRHLVTAALYSVERVLREKTNRELRRATERSEQ